MHVLVFAFLSTFPWLSVPSSALAEDPTAALQTGHRHFQRGEYQAALSAYRKAEALHWEAESQRRVFCGNDDPRGRLVPYVLYQGIALERLGRIEDAMGEYATIVLRAPVWWRHPLALHMMDLYDAAGRLDVPERFLDALGESRYAETVAFRRFLIVHRLEKERDWRSLIAHLQGPGRRDALDITQRDTALTAAHVLARHCDEIVRLLPPVGADEHRRPWVGYTRLLCGQDSDSGRHLQLLMRDHAGEQLLPEVGFPAVKTSARLPDPLVCAQRSSTLSSGRSFTVPCPY